MILGVHSCRICCDCMIRARAVSLPAIPALDGARHCRATLRNGRADCPGTGARQSHQTALQTMFINYAISTGPR